MRRPAGEQVKSAKRDENWGKKWWTHGWRVGGEKDQTAEVSSSLVAQGAGRVDESGDTISLDGRSHDAATPAGGSGGSLLGLEELLLAVGGLGAVIGVAKEGGQHSCRADLVEDDAKGNRRGLDGREI